MLRTRVVTNKRIIGIHECENFIKVRNMKKTILGWPNGAVEQYVANLKSDPTQRLHLRRYKTYCTCEKEPAPASNPIYHLKEDILPVSLTTLAGAGLGALIDSRNPKRGAKIGGLAGLGIYILARWLSK